MWPQRVCTIATFGSVKWWIVRIRKSGCGTEVGVEDGDELALARPHACVERAGLVAVAVGAVDVLDVDALRGVAAHGELGDLARLVGRVVEHLDFEQLARIVDAADRLDQPVDHVHLVVERAAGS